MKRIGGGECDSGIRCRNLQASSFVGKNEKKKNSLSFELMQQWVLLFNLYI